VVVGAIVVVVLAVVVLALVVLVVVAGRVVATVVVVSGALAGSVAIGNGDDSSTVERTSPIRLPASVVAVHAEIVTAARAANVTTLRGLEPGECDRLRFEDISTPLGRRDKG
jgi:hypothetical protein